MATTHLNKKVQSEVTIDLPECPVCMETMTAPIFQCQSGHSLCRGCTQSLVPPLCPICRQPMTQVRNWQLEKVVNKAKVPCPNKSQGCTYAMHPAVVQNHIKECVFREMECPIGAVFGKCFWRGKLNDIMEHCKERHTEYCKASFDSDIILENINTNEDDRHFFLVSQGKMLFIITFKLDTLQKKAFWTVQHIGCKSIAKQYIYELIVISNRDARRKAFFSEHCFNDAIRVDEIFRLGMCAVLPLDYLTHFINDMKLTFRLSVRWMPTPKGKQEKSDEKSENSDKNKKGSNKQSTATQDQSTIKPGQKAS